MDPPRRPWRDPGHNKSQPTLAPRPDRTTRTYPEPPALIARRNAHEGGGGSSSSAGGSTRDEHDPDTLGPAASGDDSDMDVEDGGNDSDDDDDGDGDGDGDTGKDVLSAEAKKAAIETEGPCPICQDDLPATGRGIVQCGHVFCFECILKWSKTETKCPGCREKFCSIIKTLSPEDLEKEKARRERLKRGGKNPDKKAFKKAFKLAFKNRHNTKRKKKTRSKPSRFRKLHPMVATKNIRVRPRSQRRAFILGLANEPHPQANGGFPLPWAPRNRQEVNAVSRGSAALFRFRRSGPEIRPPPPAVASASPRPPTPVFPPPAARSPAPRAPRYQAPPFPIEPYDNGPYRPPTTWPFESPVTRLSVRLRPLEIARLLEAQRAQNAARGGADARGSGGASPTPSIVAGRRMTTRRSSQVSINSSSDATSGETSDTASRGSEGGAASSPLIREPFRVTANAYYIDGQRVRRLSVATADLERAVSQL